MVLATPVGGARTVRAPRGGQISCRGWQQEAALRMLMNNLDPEVAERPQDLVVYGGSGKAARNWECFDAIVAALRRLGSDETLLVQSGKPVAVFRTHAEAPRVLIANSMLVPKWATADEFRRLEALGLTMYGQMTAGSWIYIGTQGILQGTYETLAECARQHFGGTLAGRLTVTAGLGGMGGAQPLAVTMNDGVCLVAEVDRSRIEKRLATRYLDEVAGSLDEGIARALAAKAERRAVSIAVEANAVDLLAALLERGIVPDVLTDQTSAHDNLQGYVPHAVPYAEALRLRQSDSARYIELAMASMAAHVRAMLELQRRGAVTFDYGNNLRGQALAAGVSDAFEFGGFVPLFIRPLFCEGKGPFRWAVLSGDPADLAATDDAILEAFPEDRKLARWIRHGPRARRLPGAAGTHLLAGLRRARPRRPDLQPAGGERAGEGADRHRPRPSRLRLGGLAQPRDRGDARRLRRHRRLADPQRADQCRQRRHLDLGAPRRRRRYRLLVARRHGDRSRRHRRGRASDSSAC